MAALGRLSQEVRGYQTSARPRFEALRASCEVALSADPTLIGLRASSRVLIEQAVLPDPDHSAAFAAFALFPDSIEGRVRATVGARTESLRETVLTVLSTQLRQVRRIEQAHGTTIAATAGRENRGRAELAQD